MKDRTDTARVSPNNLPRPLLYGGLGLVAVAALSVGVWWGSRSGIVDGVSAAAAVLIAAGVLYTALSLPGATRQGLLLGIGVPFAAMMAWTRLDQPVYVWAVTGVVAVIAGAWCYPWWYKWRELLKLGGFWLAVSLWAVGCVGALLLGDASVLARRVAYGGFAVVVAILIFQVIRCRDRDISIGIAAGLMICHAALLAFGSQYVFETNEYHVTSESAWGYAQSSRFWGGPLLVYHPNFIAMTGLLVAIRVGADSRFAPWQRWVAVGNGALLLYIADSRTSLLMAGVASVTYGLLHLWRNGLPRFRFWAWFATADARRLLAQALIPLAVTMIVFVAAGGTDMLFKQRYAKPEAEAEKQEAGRNVSLALSGRTEIWGMIFRDFKSDTVVEKLFGNADHPRGEILRYQDPNHPGYEKQAELSADNVLVGALRRGGIAGVMAVLAGLVLVVWRATRRGSPIWIPMVTFAGLASMISEDELVGTTPLWMLVLAGEVWMYVKARQESAEPSLEQMPVEPEPA
ncbi:MAG: O-antigen ligase family protein [Micromonosporaceae bacterium]